LDSFDRHTLVRTLPLALRHKKKVSPNPAVGCIIIKERREIATGYHNEYGGAHAEVVAINSARENLEGSQLYVSLEPCSHYGKTPPCADLIIKSGIKKVVIGMKDPNPVVAGRGIARLKEAGIEVEVADLPAFQEFYKIFTKNITTAYPFTTLKAAVSIDGKIADHNGESKWITNEHSRETARKLRAANEVLITSSRTVRADNPQLTVRDGSKPSPVRVMMSSKLFFDENLFFFQNPDGKSVIAVPEREKTISRLNDEFDGNQKLKPGVAEDAKAAYISANNIADTSASNAASKPASTSANNIADNSASKSAGTSASNTSENIVEKLKKAGIEIIFVKSDEKNHPDADELLKELKRRGFQSVMVEAGSTLSAEFINRGLADELALFIAPKIIGEGNGYFTGLNAFGLNGSLQFTFSKMRELKGDIFLTLRKESKDVHGIS